MKRPYQGVNGAILRLLALDAGQYEVPLNAGCKDAGDAGALMCRRSWVPSCQTGWNIVGTAADDLTAMVFRFGWVYGAGFR